MNDDSTCVINWKRCATMGADDEVHSGDPAAVKRKYALMTTPEKMANVTKAAEFIAELGPRSLSGLGRCIGEKAFVCFGVNQGKEYVIVEEFSSRTRPDATQGETGWFAVALPLDGDGEAVVIESRLR